MNPTINGKPMTPLQIQQYLHKLQLNDLAPAADLATLTKLQDAHLKFIPYDNFDCLNGRITSLKRSRKVLCPKCRSNKSRGEIYIAEFLAK